MKRPPPAALAYLNDALAGLGDAGLLRGRPLPYDATVPSYCSNDYLGLAVPPPGASPTGAGASRLVSGEHAEHVALERALATWLAVDDTLLFTSGYAANVGLVSALADSPEDLIFSDALNHASLVDGCRLARGRTRVYPHLDVDALRRLLADAPRSPESRRWVLTESYFSMDADSPDLRALREVCDEAGAALVVDEAHAVGVLGPEGRGLCAEVGVVPDVLVGTLGKAFGAGGAFVAGCDPLVRWLWNRARSFVFSTGLSPVVAQAGLRALERVRADEDLRRVALQRADELRSALARLGLKALGAGHVVPVVLGDSREAVRVADLLHAEGFRVRAIRPPSVPDGTARIRFTATAAQTSSDIARLVEAVGRCFT